MFIIKVDVYHSVSSVATSGSGCIPCRKLEEIKLFNWIQIIPKCLLLFVVISRLTYFSYRWYALSSILRKPWPSYLFKVRLIAMQRWDPILRSRYKVSYSILLFPSFLCLVLNSKKGSGNHKTSFKSCEALATEKGLSMNSGIQLIYRFRFSICFQSKVEKLFFHN